MKYVIIHGDGMADWPCDELGGKTPLEAAHKPNMDLIATRGTLGLTLTIPEGMPPGSDVGTMSMMGYDPKRDLKIRALPNIGDRELLESTFGVECFHSYGFHEVQWVAVECPAHDGRVAVRGEGHGAALVGTRRAARAAHHTRAGQLVPLLGPDAPCPRPHPRRPGTVIVAICADNGCITVRGEGHGQTLK